MGAYRVYDVLALGMAYMHDMYQNEKLVNGGSCG